MYTFEACLGYIGIRDIGPFHYWDMGYLRQNLMGYGIFEMSFMDMGYWMFNQKRKKKKVHLSPFQQFLVLI